MAFSGMPGTAADANLCVVFTFLKEADGWKLFFGVGGGGCEGSRGGGGEGRCERHGK